jgi:hypothetical protein
MRACDGCGGGSEAFIDAAAGVVAHERPAAELWETQMCSSTGQQN